jgi:hypothetical protein
MDISLHEFIHGSIDQAVTQEAVFSAKLFRNHDHVKVTPAIFRTFMTHMFMAFIFNLQRFGLQR